MIQANRNVASFNTIIAILQNYQSKIKLIRKCENTHKKIINNECAILFNKTCINERLLPKYKYISIYTYIQVSHANITTIGATLNRRYSLESFSSTEIIEHSNLTPSLNNSLFPTINCSLHFFVS